MNFERDGQRLIAQLTTLETVQAVTVVRTAVFQRRAEEHGAGDRREHGGAGDHWGRRPRPLEFGIAPSFQLLLAEMQGRGMQLIYNLIIADYPKKTVQVDTA